MCCLQKVRANFGEFLGLYIDKNASFSPSKKYYVVVEIRKNWRNRDRKRKSVAKPTPE